ncbi:AI-2E family transporter [Limnoglobus roseus]|uniref:AI-2E family transporter n=1 Tax=Limnoglobus roseus TaxID=2598579 RepID=A0A5C1ACV6_9BACT|nr:AI-2E family transporter [Limnoglobus roseus]QEL16475.1 AI-2E family transporter [Limnoglobus roseus]
MPPVKSCPPWQRAVILQSSVICGVIIFGILYWARSIIIPIAMALFFSYVLAPVVKFLSRRGVGHALSVVLTVAVATSLFLGTSFVITRQVTSLTSSLTKNTDQLKAKIAKARYAIAGDNAFLQGTFDDIERTIMGGVREARTPSDETTVVVGASRPRWMSSLDLVIGPITEAFGMAAFSFILVIFILLAQADLKDRLLRLVGDGAVSNTTRALDDATTRLSQYLLAQLMLNISFGLVIAFSVWCLGLQYALLWGFIAALLRYVPYLGTWIGVVLPVAFSFATTSDDELWQPIAVLVVYAVLELLCGNVIEPFLYGSKLGVSEVAQLISAAFWSFLWGPIGLILSGPISTCLVVLGRHSTRFRFLEILLGTEPPLPPEVALFQRLMSGDADDALRVIEKNTTEAPLEVFDTLIYPALVQAKAAMHSGEFTPEQLQTVIATTREVITDTIANQDQPGTDPTDPADPIGRNRLLIIPARDTADQLALDTLAGLLEFKKWKIDTLSVDTLAAELVERVNEFKPDVVCIGSLPPSGLVQVRYLCKRLRQHNKDVRILVGRWGDVANSDSFAELIAVGATAVEVKMTETLTKLASWRPLVEAEVKVEKKSQEPPLIGTGAAQVTNVVS